MKIFAAVLALVILVGPVYAQNAGGLGGGGMGGGGMGGRGGGKRQPAQNSEQQKADQEKKKAAEAAYKAGLKMIPDAKEKYDPWKNAR
jgi:hypothetical protein